MIGETGTSLLIHTVGCVISQSVLSFAQTPASGAMITMRRYAPIMIVVTKLWNSVTCYAKTIRAPDVQSQLMAREDALTACIIEQ